MRLARADLLLGLFSGALVVGEAALLGAVDVAILVNVSSLSVSAASATTRVPNAPSQRLLAPSARVTITYHSVPKGERH